MITVTNYSYNVCWILKTGDSATVKSGAIVGLTGDTGYLVIDQGWGCLAETGLWFNWLAKLGMALSEKEILS